MTPTSYPRLPGKWDPRKPRRLSSERVIQERFPGLYGSLKRLRNAPRIAAYRVQEPPPAE